MNNPLLTGMNLSNNGLGNEPNGYNIQKNYQNGPNRPNSTPPSNGAHILTTMEEPIIRDVWEDNFEEEFRTIMHLIEKYNIIGMVPFYSFHLLESGLGHRVPRHCIPCQ